MTNPILNTDSYKHSHFLQYPPGTEKVYSYIESRGGMDDRFILFGLQAYIKKCLMQVPTVDEINQAGAIVRAHGLPFNEKGWYDLNRLGYWPLEIKALPEGTLVPSHVPCVTVENTDERFAWLTSFIETGLLRAVWYPSTVATISWSAIQIIKKYLNETCCAPDWETTILPFRLHDFGARGVSSDQSAALGGLAHLVNSMGSDTMVALIAAIEFYNAKGVVAYSIPAMEHSTVTAWGQEDEAGAYSNMVDKFSGVENGLYAAVSDSYDIINAVNKIWGDALRLRVIEGKAILVVRPDSGVPEKVVVMVLNLLGDKFGFTINAKGYKVLHPRVRVIQGDGINLWSIPVILEAVKQSGWSTENIAMGMGGQLLQGCNRDTLKWAMKTSWVQVNGVGRDVFKNPVTDPGKASKKGRFAVVREDGTLKCYPEAGHEKDNLLCMVYRNSKLYVDHNFDDVRARARGEIVDMRKAA